MEPSSHALELTHKLRADRYKKELEVAERKNENLSWANKDTSRKLFEANQHGQRLALALGFRDIFEASTVVLRNPSAFSHFRMEQQMLRSRQLERELEEQQDINAELQQAHQGVLETLQQVNRDNEALKVELKRPDNTTSPVSFKLNSRTLRDLPTNHPPASSIFQRSPPRSSGTSIDLIRRRSELDDLPTDTASLRLELIELRHRYDSLLEAKAKAAAMYKRDYKKWSDFKTQMYETVRDKKKKWHRSGRSSTKQKRYDSPSTGLGAAEDTKPTFGTDAPGNHETKQIPRASSRIINETDKENSINTIPTTVRQRMHPTHTPLSLSATRFSTQKLSLPLVSPSGIQSTSSGPGSLLEQPVQDVLICESTRPKSDTLMAINSPLSSQLKRKRSEPKVAPAPSQSSETEDDSQAPELPVAFKLPAFPVRSKDLPFQPVVSAPPSPIEDDSQSLEPINRFKTSALIERHPVIPASPNNDISTHDSSVRPIKSRRTDTRNDKETWTSHLRFDPWDRSRNSKPDTEGHGSTDKSIGGTSKQDGINYSEYKGRGRYAQTAPNDGNTTINARYKIDANRNNGLDFQYDAVVRNREERKHLNAGDCDCCRDYYEAIGPLPPRLQQPLWRSPTTSPVASRTCQRRRAPGAMHPPGSGDASFTSGSGRRGNDIAQHKKDISRHRHNWERASTPPGYWNIGFPTTQEASDINEKAKEMHRQKLMMVEQEANKMDGRYRKR